MNKSKIGGLFILFLIVIPITLSTELINLDTPWEIVSQDYMQDYINYRFEKIDNNHYNLHWYVKDPFVFEALATCLSIDDDDCMNELAKNKSNVKDFEKNTKPILWLGAKYSVNDFKNSYFESYTLKKVKKDINRLMVDDFPLNLYGNSYVMGNVNPFKSDNGILEIYILDEVYNNPYIFFIVGFGTLKTQFNNSKSEESLIYSTFGGIQEFPSFTRYLALPKFGQLSSANINLTGTSYINSIFGVMDLFEQSSIDLTQWTPVCANTRVSGGRLVVTTSGISGLCFAEANVTNDFNFANRNVSILINLSSSLSSGVSICEIKVDDKTNGSTIWDYEPSGTVWHYLKIIFNESDKTAYVFNASDGTLIRNKSLANLNNYFLRLAAATGTTSASATCNFQEVGISENFTLYDNWSFEHKAPQQFKFSISDQTVFENESFEGSHNFSIIDQVNSSLNNCGCVGCIVEGFNCLIPFEFASIGGNVTYFNLEFNISENIINVTFKDVDTLKIIQQPLDVSLTNGVFLQDVTTNGSVLLGSIVAGDYEITAGNEDYLLSKFFIKEETFTENYTIFLLNNSDNTALVEFAVKDRALLPVINASIDIQRRLNNTGFVTIKNAKSDSAGFFNAHLDIRIEYRLITTHPDFFQNTFFVTPFKTDYLILMDASKKSQYNNTFEGIRYIIKPLNNQLNVSELLQTFSLQLQASESNLEVFGMKIVDSPYICIPESCQINSTNANGGTVALQVKGNFSGKINMHYFFKVTGKELQYINTNPYLFGGLQGHAQKLTRSMFDLGNEMGGDTLKSVAATVLISTFVVMGTQMGIVGLPILVVVIIGFIFFIGIGWINIIIGIISIIAMALIYVVLARNQ